MWLWVESVVFKQFGKIVVSYLVIGVVTPGPQCCDPPPRYHHYVKAQLTYLTLRWDELLDGTQYTDLFITSDNHQLQPPFGFTKITVIKLPRIIILIMESSKPLSFQIC